MRGATLIVVSVGALVGVVAEWAASSWDEPAEWLPDLAVGWAFIGCGIVAHRRSERSWIGVLMIATGFTWFVGNFMDVQVAPVAEVAAAAIVLYRGPLVHVLVTYPSGRARGVLEWVAVVAGYGVAVVRSVWSTVAITVAIASLIVIVCSVGLISSVGRVRQAKLVSVGAATAFGIALTAVAVSTSLVGPDARQPAVLAYQLTLVAIAAVLLAGLLALSWDRPEVADLVVELGAGRSGGLRDALARALGDPSLEVGYRAAGLDTFVDAIGKPVRVPEGDVDRSVTMVHWGDDIVAAIVHDREVLTDPSVVDAVAIAARLGASNVRLQAERQLQVDELLASRRRIVAVADEERRLLAQRLARGAEYRLTQLIGVLVGASRSASDEATRCLTTRAKAQLEQTIDEIRRLAHGLHPRALTERGLGPALSIVADELPIPVTVDVTCGTLPRETAAAVYFVCTEALTNVAKHAQATTARLSIVREQGSIRAVVEDDGVGGAVAMHGSGLRGLADRIEAVGGTLRVDSPVGYGAGEPVC